MDSKFLKSLFEDPEYYARVWQAYSALADNCSALTKWLESVFAEAVVAKLRVELHGQEPLRVLGVGSGTGENDVCMLTSLLKRFPNINNRVVEPAKDHLDQYKALVQSKGHDLHGVVCDWRQQTIDQYEKAGDKTKFHFVSTVHSLYFTDNLDDSLMNLYDLVEPGGVLLVITPSDNSGNGRLWLRFPMFKVLSSADVRRSFERRNIPYTNHHQAAYLDITPCFDETSEDGKMVVDMMTHVLRFHERASEVLKREVMEYLATSDCSEKNADGRTMFYRGWDAVVVCKPLK